MGKKFDPLFKIVKIGRLVTPIACKLDGPFARFLFHKKSKSKSKFVLLRY